MLVIYIHVYKLLIWCSATTKSLSLFGLVRFVTLIGKVASMVFVLESNAFQSGNSDAYEFTFFFFPHLRMLNNATNWSFVVRKKESNAEYQNDAQQTSKPAHIVVSVFLRGQNTVKKLYSF